MYKIAVMGDYDSIYGFATLGLTIFPFGPDETEEAKEALRRLLKGGYGVIYITEELASRMEDEIARYSEQIMPTIILIPGVCGNTGKGVLSVRKSVEQAVGSDILFGDEM